jgi:hypothetical protein
VAESNDLTFSLIFKLSLYAGAIMEIEGNVRDNILL